MSIPAESLDTEALRSNAVRVIQKLDSGSESEQRKPPYFVEFSGTPKSGKSTCIDIVSHFFRRTGFRVMSPTEGASRRTPGFLKDDWFAFNVWSASYALTQVLEGLNSPENYHIAILDRGLFDALAWFELLEQRGEVTADDCKRVQDFLMIEKWRNVIDCVFLFNADAVTSLERENADKLIDEPGRAMNPNSLNELNDAYAKVREKFSVDFQRFEMINTSNSQRSTAKATSFEVTQKIIDLMSQDSSK